MTLCTSCGDETSTVIYKPVRIEPDGYIRLDGPFCRACGSPAPVISTSFVRGAAQPVAGRDFPVVKRNAY